MEVCQPSKLIIIFNSRMIDTNFEESLFVESKISHRINFLVSRHEEMMNIYNFLYRWTLFFSGLKIEQILF